MVRFGPSGNCDLFYDQGFKSSLDAPAWIKNRGLNAYEYSFSRGFNMSDFLAKSLGDNCKEHGITLSLHAPYYINFANPDEKMIEKSMDYILNSIKYLKTMGAERIVFHPGTCGELPREEAVKIMNKNVKRLVERIDSEHFDFPFMLCPETMGKHGQLGTVEEVAELCSYSKYLVPTLDFGHINAFNHGSLKTDADYEKIFTFLIDKLGESKVKNIHIHFSKIEYGEKGEIKHLTFDDTTYGPEFEPLARVIKKLNLEPVIICESRGTQGEDASTMQEIYNNIKEI